jgi:hypothetical protein
MQRITTTIEREWLAKIIDGSKTAEYREMKPYWEKRLSRVAVPFELRLINGMQVRAPEVTVIIGKVKTNRRRGVYELHISKIQGHKNWDKRRGQPTAHRAR